MQIPLVLPHHYRRHQNPLHQKMMMCIIVSEVPYYQTCYTCDTRTLEHAMTADEI